jgi:hypothetical protein
MGHLDSYIYVIYPIEDAAGNRMVAEAKGLTVGFS